MFTITRRKKAIVPLALATGLLLTGCGEMKNVIEKEGGELAPKNDNLGEDVKDKVASINEDEEVDPSLDNYELSDDQKELLKESESQTAEDAIGYVESNLSELAVLDTSQKMVEKEQFTDAEEAAKYISYYFFNLDANLMTADQFYKGIKNHLGDAFLEQFPEKEEDRIQTFEAAQKSFTEFLKSKIVSYKVSELEYTHMKFGASFHRVYILENGEQISYLTSIERDDNDNWKIVANGSSPGFIEKK